MAAEIGSNGGEWGNHEMKRTTGQQRDQEYFRYYADLRLHAGKLRAKWHLSRSSAPPSPTNFSANGPH